MKKLLVVFTGAGSTGKTTLLQRIKERLKDDSIIYITESIRNLIKDRILQKVDINADDYSQLVITSELSLRFWESLNKDSYCIISERSPICTLAYARVQNCSEYIKDLNKRFLKNILNSKDISLVVIYFPPIIPFVEDSIRNKEGAKRVDAEIRNILSEFNIRHFSLLTTNLDDRTNLVIDIINTYKNS